MGGVLVTIFFLISGALLYANNGVVDSLRVFYYKRWKSIFPMFWVVWLIFYLPNVRRFGQFFYKVEASDLSILFSIFGVDGYAYVHGIENYYHVGEWFLGVLLILYLLYPVIVRLMRYPKILFAIFMGLWGLSNIFYPQEIGSFVSLPSCLLSFFVGMLVEKYQILDRHGIYTILLLLPVLITLKIEGLNFDVASHIVGVLPFLFIVLAGKNLCKSSVVSVITKLSMITYPVFLLQHKVIVKVLAKFSPNNVFESVLEIIGVVILIFILAFLLNGVMERIFHSRCFKTFENYVFEKRI